MFVISQYTEIRLIDTRSIRKSHCLYYTVCSCRALVIVSRRLLAETDNVVYNTSESELIFIELSYLFFHNGKLVSIHPGKYYKKIIVNNKWVKVMKHCRLCPHQRCLCLVPVENKWVWFCQDCLGSFLLNIWLWNNSGWVRMLGSSIVESSVVHKNIQVRLSSNLLSCDYLHWAREIYARHLS